VSDVVGEMMEGKQ